MTRSKPDFGPAVSPSKQVRYTSVSALQTFDPLTYGGCNRRWYYKYVLNKPEPSTKAQKAGVEIHEQIEHYLTTGRDVLSPIVRAGKHLLPKPGSDLLVERDFGDAKKAIELRDARLASSSTPGWDAAFDAEIEKIAGLSAAGIPLVGFIDVRHRRGEYVDEAGEVRKERYRRVTEVIDHKSTSNLDYAKKAEDLGQSVQMVGYACVSDVREGSDFVRLSHINYQTRGAKSALKVTTVLSVEEAARRWERVHGIGRTMIDAARAERPEDVEGNVESCGAFRIGCPHASYCDIPKQQSIHDLFHVEKGDQMSGRGLFDTVPESPANGSANGTGLFASLQEVTIDAPPDLPSVTYDDEVRRLAAEDGVAYVAYGTCGCGASLNSLNASRLRDGTVKHIGCPRSVNPPEKPAADIVAQAAPLSPEAIAEITDPALRTKVEAHREEHLRRQAATAQTQGSGEKKSGRCPAGGERITFTPQEIQAMAAQGRAKKIPCRRCGKVVGIKLSEDKTATTIPGHLMLKTEAPPEISGDAPPDLPPELETPPALPEEYRAPGALPGQTAMPFTKDSFDVALARTMVKDAMKKLAQVLEALG